jgi:hypothetical protein
VAFLVNSREVAKLTETPAPIDEDRYGRRAGEIIARATRHVRDAVHHPGKRK